MEEVRYFKGKICLFDPNNPENSKHFSTIYKDTCTCEACTKFKEAKSNKGKVEGYLQNLNSKIDQAERDLVENNGNIITGHEISSFM